MDRELWRPSKERADSSSMRRFIDFVNGRRSLGVVDYDGLYRWSVDRIGDFWTDAWDFLDLVSSRRAEVAVDDPLKMPGAKWFDGARLNFAENLLRYRDDRAALVFKGEASPTASTMTYAELYDEVARVAAGLRALGVTAGDRVAAYMPNLPQTIVAMLATASIGALWSSCSPDFGIKGVLDRLGQTKPRVLFAADGYSYKGKAIDCLAKVGELLAQLPAIERVVVVPYVSPAPDISPLRNSVRYADFLGAGPAPELEFEQLPFDHPLYIMFTSGTTGLPKCMVQGAGGILLNQKKELVLHTDLGRDDAIFYFTTCGWMMWNWLACALSVGARIVLFDGNPFYPDSGALWRLAVEQGVTVFGTSAGYIAALQAEGAKPGRDFDLSKVRTILSTGSPLSDEGFEYVYREIKADVQLSSISGGSDINGCFALGNPLGPVYSGELQCRGLGMKVEALDESGRSVVGVQGELVCAAAAPCMPIYFWDDPDGARYRAAYFERYPGIWRHGDFSRVSERGGVAIYGRSDATLNPGGVRIGTAEIYRQAETIEGIADSLVVGQDWRGDVRVILFVKMAPGSALDDAMRDRIRKTIRANASPRHVPAKIIEVPDIPYTLNMKKVEIAVKRTIEGLPVPNRDALKNPESLEFFASIAELGSD
jgi:acetoacetyl-CoA synthetase